VLDDLEVPAVALVLTSRGQFFAAVGRIRPNLLEARDEELEPPEELACAGHVMTVRRGDIAGDGQAQGIDQEVTLAPRDALIGPV
jgi:hypothetical protein